eukprot:3395644-Rhodomonas_salina.1
MAATPCNHKSYEYPKRHWSLQHSLCQGKRAAQCQLKCTPLRRSTPTGSEPETLNYFPKSSGLLSSFV